MAFDEFKLIDCEKITKCVNCLKKYTTNADRIIREGQFYLNIEYNKIIPTSDIDEKILIQGVVDFVAIRGEEAILIDFKTNREKNDEKLKEKYKIQLECYKIAVENAIKKKVSRKILYSFFKDCEISFDN
jgi:ATP-dependent helicase/nuclease subunit A